MFNRKQKRIDELERHVRWLKEDKEVEVNRLKRNLRATDEKLDEIHEIVWSDEGQGERLLKIKGVTANHYNSRYDRAHR